MNHSTRSILPLLAILGLAVVLALPGLALAQGAAASGASDDPAVQTKSLFDYVTGGGVVGYIIIATSIAAVALVVDLLLRLKQERLFPDSLVKHAMELAEQGRAGEILSMSKASDTMFGRIIGGGLERARYGIEAVRQEVQQLGEVEIRKLRNRVGHVAVIATAAPMLGLLGTVIGMVQSFSVLGESKNAARPDELAAGISLALITTCQGLIVAIPLIFVHMYLRDRVTAVSQEAGHIAEKLLALLATGSANRQRTMAAQPQQQPQAQQQPQHSTNVAPPQQHQPAGAFASTAAPMPPASFPPRPPVGPPPLGAPPLGAPPIGMPPVGGASTGR
ncbi:MAG TPA: MotA/TolQ/ExbB proton channel family protein [Tepidisphaeraceae bacterium]|nr:MotA/TolQ/ExbB proton channel family protein [Tepidisphaeraceae bacterium]